MPALYEHQGIRFQYPENWSLDEAEAADGSVTVYSPEGGLWSLVWRDISADPQELVEEAVQSLKTEYAHLETDPVQETIAGRELKGVDVSFYYVDLVNTAHIRGFRTPEASLMVLYQAEDRDFSDLEAVFRAITASLLQAS